MTLRDIAKVLVASQTTLKASEHHSWEKTLAFGEVLSILFNEKYGTELEANLFAFALASPMKTETEWKKFLDEKFVPHFEL
jgi:hypothetical protein